MTKMKGVKGAIIILILCKHHFKVVNALAAS